MKCSAAAQSPVPVSPLPGAGEERIKQAICLKADYHNRADVMDIIRRILRV